MSQKQNVLLIYPGNIQSITKRMPLSILFLAESLIKEGYTPVLLDMQVDSFSKDLLRDTVCVGISTLTGGQINYGLAVARLIREANPEIPIVWGGIHPSIMPEQTARHPLVDYVVYGEGETAFPILVQALSSKSDMTKVPNLAYREGNGVRTSPKMPFINFNRANTLPYELLSLSKYQTSTRFEYQSSRGCPQGCLFCYNKGFNEFKWRAKDTAIVLDELEYIEKKFNPEYLFFVDDEFFIHRKRAQEIVSGMIDRGFGFKWKASIRIDTVNSYGKDMLDLLDRSRFMEMVMGAESGSDRILSLVKKKIKRADIVASARHLSGSKIIPQYSFMAGFPGETADDLGKTIDCIDELRKINSAIKINGLFFATPFPGTELFELACANGYRPPSILEEWADIDFILSYKNVPYIPQEFKRRLVVFAFIVRFRYLWMHSASFLQNAKNITTFKYWGFIAFRVLFKPFDALFRFRWRLRFTRFPVDIMIARLLLSKIAA
jgi:anaerobic magnesium-protoporphyrin IX monomethyl ester cyclase